MYGVRSPCPTCWPWKRKSPPPTPLWRTAPAQATISSAGRTCPSGGHGRDHPHSAGGGEDPQRFRRICGHWHRRLLPRPRAAIELLQGPNHNIGKGKGNPQIFFAGNGLSTRHWNELTRLLEGKDFSIAIISKSGTTTEPAIATRALRWMLERKYGTEGAKSRIYAITDPCKGALRQMATEEGWETFVIPPDVGGRYSVLTPWVCCPGRGRYRHHGDDERCCRRQGELRPALL